MIQIILLINWKKFCSDNLERADGSLTLTCFVSPWKCKASGPAFSWGNSNSIFLQESVQTWISFWQCFWYVYRLPWGRRAAQATSIWPRLLWKQRTPCGTLEEATTPRLGLPQHREVGAQLQQTGRRATKGVSMPAPKVALLPALTSIRFTTLVMACVNFTTTTPTRLTGLFHPVLGRKNKKLQLVKLLIR